MERQQFTFYRSFWEAVKLLLSCEDRLAVISAICSYALDEEDIALDGVPAAVFALVRPTLDSSRNKAQNRIKCESNEEQTEIKSEQTKNKSKQTGKEKEKEREKDIYTPIVPKVDEDFEIFWKAYPKKVGKGSARKAFGKVKVPVETLVTAIRRQECSDQWSRDNGQYIPHPSTWLNQERWEDEIGASTTEE